MREEAGSGLVLLALPILVIAATTGAQAAGDVFDEAAVEAARVAQLQAVRAQATAHLGRAKGLFRQIGEIGASSEQAAQVRRDLLAELAQARELALEVADGDPAAEGWSDQHLSQVDSLAFWVRRLAPLDLTAGDEPESRDQPEDAGPATPGLEPAAVERTTYSPLNLPSGVVPSSGSRAEQALREADEARKSLPARALYRYLEAFQAPDAGENVRRRAREAMDALRTQLRPLELVEHLDEEWLGSSDPMQRVFAANELGALGLKQAVNPLVAALETEELPEVRVRIQEALALSPRGVAAQALGKLGRSARTDLAGLVIDTLAEHLGGRRAADALAGLALGDDPLVWRHALRALVAIGGESAAAALGKVTRDRRVHPKLMQESFHALAALQLPAAAEPLLPHLKRKGKYLYPARDGLIVLGGHAIPSLVRALAKPRQRNEANECLRRITGEKFSPNAERWKEWYRSWVARGRPELP